MPSLFPALALMAVSALALPQSAPAAPAVPATGPKPSEIDGMGFGGGAFGMNLANLTGLIANSMDMGDISGVLSTGSKGAIGAPKMEKDTSGGSGPYKAGWFTDPGLAAHTIYAPKTAPPASIKMPLIVWGNGGCFAMGLSFENFLTEIASYGYVVIANGPPNNQSSSGNSGIGSLLSSVTSGQTKPSDMTASIDWMVKNAATFKFGSVDVTKVAAAGQSCGGMEAYSASFKDPRVKQTVLFNSGCLDRSRQPMLAELKAPVAYFLGGPTDLAYSRGSDDFKKLPAALPALLASLDVGHIGTYFGKNGGEIGKAAVSYFEAVFRGDTKAKALFTANKAELLGRGWNITTRNW